MKDNVRNAATGYKTCYQCGKEFYVMYQDLWRYKRGNLNGGRWFCSWKCLRAYERTPDTEPKKRRSNMKVTDEQKRRAVEIALEGKSPIEYLESIGVNAPRPMWTTIRKRLEKEDPETYAVLPDFRTRGMKKKAKAEAPEEPEEAPAEAKATVTLDGPVVIRTAEPEKVELVYDGSIREEYMKEQKAKAKITKPLMYDGNTVRCVENEFGLFFYDAKHNMIDWTTPDGEEVSLTPKAFKIFATETLPKVMAILGADPEVDEE